jgi:hypothetical protein
MQISVHMVNQQSFSGFTEHGTKVKFQKTETGWHFMSFEPGFDSDWVEAELNSEYTFNEMTELALELLGV